MNVASGLPGIFWLQTLDFPTWPTYGCQRFDNHSALLPSITAASCLARSPHNGFGLWKAHFATLLQLKAFGAVERITKTWAVPPTIVFIQTTPFETVSACIRFSLLRRQCCVFLSCFLRFHEATAPAGAPVWPASETVEKLSMH